MILAIDAAWTNTEPSGVALMERTGADWRCLAVAPSYDSFLRIAEGQSVDWSDRRFLGTEADVGRLLLAAQALSGGKQVDIVTLDMPVATVPITSRRAADDAISKAYGARWCAALTPNSERPGPIGERLSAAFRCAGYPLATSDQRSGETPRLVEVYPHPALLSFLGRDRRVPYKVSKAKRYWPDESRTGRIEKLLSEFAAIRDAAASAFDFRLQLPEA